MKSLICKVRREKFQGFRKADLLKTVLLRIWAVEMRLRNQDQQMLLPYRFYKGISRIFFTEKTNQAGNMLYNLYVLYTFKVWQSRHVMSITEY